MKLRSIHTDQEPDGAVAKLEADTVPSNFTPLGEATQAVVMRLQSKLPRLRVMGVRTAPREDEEQSRPR